jgi:RNA polymerase sigma-B factor
MSDQVSTSVTDPRGPRQRAKDMDRLTRYQRHRDPADREALAERFLPLAQHLAHRYGNGADREDLEQVAAVGLLKALERFDASREIAFTTFAVPTILGELKRYFRDLGWSVRVPRELQELAARVDVAVEALTRELGRSPTTEQIAQRCDSTVEKVLEARSLGSAHFADSLDHPLRDGEEEPVGSLIGGEDPGFDRAEQAVDVERMLARLPERDARILRLRFEEDLVQREIAAKVGLSQMQVSRSITQSITALRDGYSAGSGRRPSA